jgi:hypothetical protein
MAQVYGSGRRSACDRRRAADALAGDVDAWTIGFALWQAMPFAAILLLRRSGFSDVGVVVTAVVVSALTVAGYVAVSSSDSSTAAVGLLIFPCGGHS